MVASRRSNDDCGDHRDVVPARGLRGAGPPGSGAVHLGPRGSACSAADPRLVLPLVLLLGGVAITILGARHFALGWPGTGGHPWAHQHLLPGRVAAFGWAATASI